MVLWAGADSLELSIQQWNKDKLANVEAIALLLMVIVFGLATQHEQRLIIILAQDT